MTSATFDGMFLLSNPSRLPVIIFRYGTTGRHLLTGFEENEILASTGGTPSTRNVVTRAKRIPLPKKGETMSIFKAFFLHWW